jgi:hypothetical protein
VFPNGFPGGGKYFEKFDFLQQLANISFVFRTKGRPFVAEFDSALNLTTTRRQSRASQIRLNN